MGKTEKMWKGNHATTVTKIAKTKRQQFGMNENSFKPEIFIIPFSNYWFGWPCHVFLSSRRWSILF